MFLKSGRIIYKLQLLKLPLKKFLSFKNTSRPGLFTCRTNPYPPVRFIDFCGRILVILKTSRWCKPTSTHIAKRYEILIHFLNCKNKIQNCLCHCITNNIDFACHKNYIFLHYEEFIYISTFDRENSISLCMN